MIRPPNLCSFFSISILHSHGCPQTPPPMAALTFFFVHSEQPTSPPSTSTSPLHRRKTLNQRRKNIKPTAARFIPVVSELRHQHPWLTCTSITSKHHHQTDPNRPRRHRCSCCFIYCPDVAVASPPSSELAVVRSPHRCCFVTAKLTQLQLLQLLPRRLTMEIAASSSFTTSTQP